MSCCRGRFDQEGVEGTYVCLDASRQIDGTVYGPEVYDNNMCQTLRTTNDVTLIKLGKSTSTDKKNLGCYTTFCLSFVSLGTASLKKRASSQSILTQYCRGVDATTACGCIVQAAPVDS